MRLTFFHGHIVTANDDLTIPLNSNLIGSPIAVAHTLPDADKLIAVDRDWVVLTFNGMLAEEKRILDKLQRENDRIVKLLETQIVLREAITALREAHHSQSREDWEAAVKTAVETETHG